MSEALRRAAERVLTGSAISAGSKQFHDDVRLLARAALEGQAPEHAARAKAIEECLQVAQDMLYAGPTAIIAAIRALKEAR
jgi:hypothetical protein